jgi:coproporphyrinogen III oxidase-like Fe-S oxidoreductase
LRFATTHATQIFPRTSIDLIFGRHGRQSVDAWREELRFALGELGLQHLSLYELSIEEGTSFDRLKKRNRLSLCSEEISAELYDACMEVAADYGLQRYEGWIKWVCVCVCVFRVWACVCMLCFGV